MQENKEYLIRTSPSYYQIQNEKIIPITISFPLKPISFQRDEMFENIFYEKFREIIPYDYILLFGISPPENYLEIPFYFYSFDKDLYASVDSNHPFYGLWYSLLKPISSNDPKSPWYDIGKICEESSEIWIHEKNLLKIDLLMRLSLCKVNKKIIFFENRENIEWIKRIYSKSICWLFYT